MKLINKLIYKLTMILWRVWSSSRSRCPSDCERAADLARCSSSCSCRTLFRLEENDVEQVMRIITYIHTHIHTHTPSLFLSPTHLLTHTHSYTCPYSHIPGFKGVNGALGFLEHGAGRDELAVHFAEILGKCLLAFAALKILVLELQRGMMCD